MTLLGSGERLNVVQIGANDGMVNDPIFPFMKKHRDSTRVLLIEPQQQLIPHLKANYSWHPDATIVDAAIGPAGSMTLFSIREDCWAGCSAPYARSWPDYRAPTGITSTSRDHVRNWAAKHYRGPVEIDEVIVEMSVRCSPLAEVLDGTPFVNRTDLLQVDTEGYDDEILYHSDIPRLQPRLINFESAELPAERAEHVGRFLESNGYTLLPGTYDTLAIRAIPAARP